MRRPPSLVPVALSGLLLTAACGTPALSGSALAKEVSSQLTAKVGQKPDRVSCPEDLKAEVGATTRCTLTASGQTYGVIVRATSVQGSNVKFSIQVDARPQ